MPWKVENPDSLMVEMAYSLYNSTSASDLPAPAGPGGINEEVWTALISLTKKNCETLKIPLIQGSLKGWCIWASVVAAKFHVIKFAYIDSRVIRVKATGDHYFVAVKKTKTDTAICDITCNQFGGPDFITGSLRDVKGEAQKVTIGGLKLYDAYVLGAASNTFVI